MTSPTESPLGLLPLEQHASFFKLCITAITAQADIEPFTQWMLDTGQRLMPQLLAQPLEPNQREAFFRILARKIWQSTPLPHKNYAIETLPPPPDEAPCFCGSAQMFARCCKDRERFAADLPPLNLLPFFLDSLPEARWRDLAHSQIPVAALAEQAYHMLQQNQAGQVQTLLEPWFATPASNAEHWPDQYWPLLQTLLAAYQQTDQAEQELALATQATQHPAKPVRSIGLLHLASLQARHMQFDQAWQTLHAAGQIAPDHPELAKIEVTLLLYQENWQQASERGHFWALRFRRLYGDAMQATIELLERIASNPEQALARPATVPASTLAALLELAQAAPPPESAYRLQMGDAASVKLEPGTQLQEALDEWYQKYTFLPQQVELKGVPYALAWQMADQWLPELQQNPILWQSFEVLDDLIRMIANGHPHTAKSATQPLVVRGSALFIQLQRRLQAQGCRLNWQIVENRPAMHLAILHLDNLIDQGQRSTIINWLETILQTFDQADEQHWREVLMPFYLEQARYQDALALARRYPNDTINMRYDHALALFMQGQQQAANARLASAIACYPMIAMALLARRSLGRAAPPGKRKTDADHQSDLTSAYCETHHGLWPEVALDWLETQYQQHQQDQQEHAP